jgi:hypothetical protein
MIPKNPALDQVSLRPAGWPSHNPCRPSSEINAAARRIAQSHSFTIVQISFLQIGRFGSALFAHGKSVFL